MGRTPLTPALDMHREKRMKEAFIFPVLLLKQISYTHHIWRYELLKGQDNIRAISSTDFQISMVTKTRMALLPGAWHSVDPLKTNRFVVNHKLLAACQTTCCAALNLN